MGKFADCLIVSDLDGTFLSKKNLDKNIEAVEKFKEQGGIFTFATGRDINSLREVVPNAGEIANAPVINVNGARLFDFSQDKYIYNCEIKNKKLIADTLHKIAEKFPEAGVRLSCENNMIVPTLNDMLRWDLRNVSLDKMQIIEMPIDELVKSDINIYKIVLVDEPENLEVMRKICTEADKNNELFWVKAYMHGLESVNVKSTKGQAALWLREHIGGKRRLFTIGDYENDIDMIKAADFGAAPENALEHVKAAAKIITASCDDGAIADYINIISKLIP